MEIQVVITNEGKLSIFSKEGTFLEGKEKIDLLLQILKAQGVEFDLIGDVEQHTHDKPKVSVKTKSKST